MSKSTEVQSQEEAWAVRKEEKRRKKEGKTKTPKEDVETDAELLRKRKRDPLPEELEIDVALPEPMNKKELRKAKKAKTNPKAAADGDADSSEKKHKSGTKDKEEEQKAGARSEFGVWIGNLPWSATRDSLREFITENTEITHEQITRVNMPPPIKVNPDWTRKPLNRGFAYVDFSDQLSMYAAIALTETKMDGRPLLIKNAKSFEGRPDKPKEETGADGKTAGAKGGNPPNKRVFVGNLTFDVTKEDLQEHYSQCGEIADLFMATFEDSGKSKGYAWVTFETVEAATAAVKGYIFKEQASAKKGKKDDDESDEEGEKEKKGKKQKWFVNRLMGRELRCEFAEDKTTRYNKRYGKEKKSGPSEPVEGMDGLHPDRLNRLGEDEPTERRRPPRAFGGDKPPRTFGGDKKPRGKVDPRTIKSGAAHTSAPRAPQGIVPSEGKKTTFE